VKDAGRLGSLKAIKLKDFKRPLRPTAAELSGFPAVINDFVLEGQEAGRLLSLKHSEAFMSATIRVSQLPSLQASMLSSLSASQPYT
jgi:hypothetical protein